MLIAASGDVVEGTVRLLEESANCAAVSDFDDHFDNVARDWRNTHLVL